MGIQSLDFIFFICGVVTLTTIMPPRWRGSIVFPLSTACFLWLQMPSPERIATLLAFCLFGWAVSRLARLGGSFVLPAAIALTLGAYLAVRLNPWLPDASGAAQGGAIIGIAFILIRILQVIVDSHEDPSINPNPLVFLTFLLGWPWLIAGPIQRWQDFESQRRALSAFNLDRPALLKAASRIVAGYFLVLVLGDGARRIWSACTADAFSGLSPMSLGLAQTTYFIYLSFDFIGYTEIVLGLAALCGFRLPENFNHPWMSTSYLDFWTRWHMTMAGFFRTYVFTPILRKLTYRRPTRRAAPANATFALFATFFMVGLWHGVTWHLLVCGLLLGGGAAVNQIYRFAARAKPAASPLRSYGLGVVTITYVCISITPLWFTSLSLDQTGRLFATLGLAGLVLSIATVFVAVSIALATYKASRFAAAAVEREVWHTALLAGLAIGVIHVYRTVFPGNAIAFVYQAF